MWSRFQIGSKRPLAKRRARMLSAASLPRKWSIRNTCSSRKTSWTISFRRWAEARSVPNGFSIITRARSFKLGLAEHARSRRPPLSAARSGSGAARSPRRARRAPRRPRPSAASPPRRPARRRAAARSRPIPPGRTRGGRTPGRPSAANSRNSSSESSSIEIPTTRNSGISSGLEEVQQPRQQLAPRQIPGGAEDAEHVRRQRRHRPHRLGWFPARISDRRRSALSIGSHRPRE